MSSSLKSFIPGMARLLGTTPAALYERQRALVRAGLLQMEGKGGPGSGVRSTSESISRLLIAAIATDNLSECAKHTKKILESEPIKGNCPITSENNFERALVYIMLSPFFTTKLAEITISRNSPRAMISFDQPSRLIVSEFISADYIQPPIRIDATVSKESLGAIAADMRALISEELVEEGGIKP